MESVSIFFHGNCFDGAASAALFKNFYENHLNNKVEFNFIPLAHEVGFSFDDRMFTGDVNVVLDFRYPPNDKVSWWYDHHRTTFINSSDRKHLDSRGSNGNFHWDPDSPSNASMMLNIFKTKFGFESDEWHENLAEWADIIDGARFESPDLPVEILEPAIAFSSLLEHNNNSNLLEKFINDVSDGILLDQLAAKTFWSNKLNSIRQKVWDLVEDVKGVIEVKQRVSFVEITNDVLSGFNKFIPYYLAPVANYSVALLKYDKTYKISVGINPWAKLKRQIESLDIGLLCEEYGGGGHYSVGGIPFLHDQYETASSVASEIVEKLRVFSKRQDELKKQEIIENNS
jgi:hypothetical protein